MSPQQGDSRARRGPLTDVIHGESETFWDAVPKVGKQQTLVAYSNWLAGEQDDEIPIVPDIPDPCLEAAPGAFHKLFDEAYTIGAMRQRIRRYLTDQALFKSLPLSWMGVRIESGGEVNLVSSWTALEV